MKLIKAKIENKQVYIIDNNKTILVKDCLVFNSQKNSNGYVIANEDIWLFIDNDTLQNITLPLIDLFIETLTQINNNLTQIANSVATSQYINPSGSATPIITTIQTDIQPLKQKINKIKEDVNKIKNLY